MIEHAPKWVQWHSIRITAQRQKIPNFILFKRVLTQASSNKGYNTLILHAVMLKRCEVEGAARYIIKVGGWRAYTVYKITCWAPLGGALTRIKIVDYVLGPGMVLVLVVVVVVI